MNVATELVYKVSLREPALTMIVILQYYDGVRCKWTGPRLCANFHSIAKCFIPYWAGYLQGFGDCALRQLSELCESALAELQVIPFGHTL
jgi:hypothetical protein